MVDQQRFDELAKGLATNQLSRWQLLKAFWSGVLLGSVGVVQPWSASLAEAQTRAVKKAPVGSPSNPRKNYVQADSCEKFNRYIQKKGVTDESGKKHPRDGAVTTFGCKWARKLFKTEVKSRNKKRVCLHTTQLLVETPFELDPTVTVAVWKPPKPLSAGCKCEKTNYVEALEEHERWHVDDINEVEANHNETWSKNPPKLKACGPTLEEAKNVLENKIRNRARSECKRIHEEIIRRARKFDDTYKLSPMDCSFCQPGQKSAQKASDSKCVSETCGPKGVTCPPDKADCCNGKCVNIQTNFNNCGRCGKKCATGQACKEGVCMGNACGGLCGSQYPNFPTCCVDPEDGRGHCANLQTGMDWNGNRLLHCGQCWHQCKLTDTCNNGQCVP